MSIGSSQQNAANLKILLVLSFGHLATDICQSALPAILPFLKAKLLLSYTMTGVIMLASNITSSVIQPVFGYLSDQKEKAFLLPFGCLCAGLGLSLLPIPDHYEIVLCLVIVSGLGIALYHPEGFKTARFFTGDKMATGLAVFTVGGNVGLALGPVVATFIITHFGLDYMPFMLLFSLIFLSLLLRTWRVVSHARPRLVPKGSTPAHNTKGAYLSIGLIVAAVIMRSWTHFGLMAYIPFYYIDYEKGDPLYAGTLVSVFLAGGAVGTLVGSPLADRWGYKRYLIFSMALTSTLFPLIFVTHGSMLFVSLGIVGMALISSFTITMVMAQELLPRNLGVASGLVAGFAIGTGGIGVTILGVIADHFGVPTALKSIMVLPLVGLLISCIVRYPIGRCKSSGTEYKM
ncbi:MAG: MFS transporter [Desulfomonile sp.]|nr:MFS transporter [Deltaproteobacteria bacterium]